MVKNFNNCNSFGSASGQSVSRLYLPSLCDEHVPQEAGSRGKGFWVGHQETRIPVPDLSRPLNLAKSFNPTGLGFPDLRKDAMRSLEVFSSPQLYYYQSQTTLK